ncbi:MAG TPA: phosphotransferase [Propionibacteriaceae bacterium]|nr:phosphotransferase [Propionibacteriaceae bacterium]
MTVSLRRPGTLDLSGQSDAGLPSYDLLQDEPQLRQWLAERGEVLQLRRYQRYKPATSLVMAVELGSGPAFLYGVSPVAAPKLEKLVAKAPVGSVLAVDRSRLLLLARIEADRDLPALKDVPAAAADLSRDGSRLQTGPVTTLVHKPQRRWVGLATSDEQQVLLRAYRAQVLPDAVARYRLARSIRAGSAQRVIATSPRHALMAVPYLPGRTLEQIVLADAEPGRSSEAALRATGQALATMHARPCDPAAVPVAQHAWPAATAQLISTLLPALAADVAEILRRLRRTQPRPNPATVCHGDFSADQVILSTDEELRFIDFDRAGLADPATDLAGLRAAGLRSTHFDTVLSGYTTVRAEPAHLDWHVAHARLLQAADPFRSARPDWPQLIADRLRVLQGEW